MNPKLKYLSLLVILPLFTLAIATKYVVDADALKSKGRSASSYGSATKNIVCGDRLCSEVDDKTVVPTVPKVEEEAVVEEAVVEEAVVEEAVIEEAVVEEAMVEEATIEEKDLNSHFKLSRANVPATIPLHQGYYNGKAVYFIITDSSNQTLAEIITLKQGWKVEFAPPLANAPEVALSTTYIFTNGVEGEGIFGFQGELFTSTPAQPEEYSALMSLRQVTWNEGSAPVVLASEKTIFQFEREGRVTLTELPGVLNMPQIVWPGDQMSVKKDKTLTADTPYSGGQVLDIDFDEMTVTFIAHRGWGPDGRTIYYIVTDATPVGPANVMGVTYAPTSASLIANSAAVDLFQFKNGIKGPGPLGFQPGIAAAAPGDETYSPMWRIYMIFWEDPNNALILETRADIDAFKSAGLIKVNIARPMDSDHIVNCPFIDPFQ